MKFEFSAGGVVFRKSGEQVEILLGKHSQHHNWVFPKGLIGDHPSAGSGQVGQKETKEVTALREVQEETGITGRILHPLTPETFWYSWNDEKRKKTVYYYIMEYVSGDTKDHDFEMEDVRWMPLHQIEQYLHYPTDKKVWAEAKQLIADGKWHKVNGS